MKLIEFLDRSKATPAFRRAVDEFLSSGSANDRIEFTAGSPPIKIERTLIKLLEELPEEAIEQVRIEARSGCEYFRGELHLATAATERTIFFDWDCKWKAMEQGWVDYFGFPDQTRAAREFGYACFREWSAKPITPLIEN